MTPQELRDWRKALDLTQEQAARALGVTLRGYSKWESGTTQIAERVELAAKMYLRIHRSKHGFNGRPLLYVAHVYWSDNSTAKETYLVIARDQHEALQLTYAELGATPRVVLVVEAVADAPNDTKPRLIGSLAEIVRRKRVKFI